MQKKTFNFYCDESTHLENDHFPFMLIGYVSAAWNQVKLHSKNILRLKQDHRYKGEIKWSKLSESNYPFYADLIEYFFATDLSFRAVIVDKARIDNKRMGFSHNDFYYRMYYQLLHHKINMEHTYNVYIDIKDTCSYEKNRKLRQILNVNYGNVRNLQFIHSHESALLQTTDVLMGAVNYHLRGERKVIAKHKIINKIQTHANRPLNCSTPLGAEKFNLFFIELK